MWIGPEHLLDTALLNNSIRPLRNLFRLAAAHTGLTNPFETFLANRTMFVLFLELESE